jgi:molecular chaperone DnaK
LPLDYQQFVQAVGESGLLSHDELRLFREGLPPEKRIATVEALSEELVRHKKLTRYQAERIASGEHEGLLLGNYAVVDLIGRGGMGEVYKARHRFMKRIVAMKVLPEAAVDSPAAVKRFQREMETAARLVHPNIVTAFDAAFASGRWYLVMEYVDGVDLATLLKRHRGSLPVPLVTACMVQAARGLAYAHSQGVVHRDIKPTNLLLDRKGLVKILDMGLVRLSRSSLDDAAMSDESLTLDNQIVGTVDYMSPEQAEDSSKVDARSDIYGLGCTMYRLLTGRMPYSGETPMKLLLAHQSAAIPSLRALRNDVSPALDTVFRRMLAKRPVDRQQSMEELVRELEACGGVPEGAALMALADEKTQAARNAASAQPSPSPAPQAVAARAQPLAKSAAVPRNIPSVPMGPAIAQPVAPHARTADATGPSTAHAPKAAPAAPMAAAIQATPLPRAGAAPKAVPAAKAAAAPAAPIAATPVAAAPPRPASADEETEVRNADVTALAPQSGSGTAVHYDRSLGPAVGIDLGTTFSAIAYLDDLGRPQTLLNAEGEKTTASVVLIEGDEVVVGREAVKAMANEMEQIAECAKRDMGQRLFHKALGGRQYPPEAIQAWVLAKLRRDAEKRIGRFRQAVITVPAYFDEVRRKATQDAAYIAGFDVADIINEPTAAAIAYGFRQGFLAEDSHAEAKRILVYDLGGGTFDVTVMEVGGREFTALATDGDVQLGGRDFDQRLIDFAAEEFIRKFGVDPRENPNAFGRLWRECEDAKHTLSARSRAVISCDHAGHALRVEVTRETFQSITSDLLDRTRYTTRQTLQAAGLEWSDVDRVLLVGGSSRMPAVVEMLRQLTGKEPDRSISPDEAVAQGAALQAGLLLSRAAGRRPRYRVKNVNSHSLGVVATETTTKRPRNAVVIPRNTPLPVSAKRVFRTKRKGQKSVLVQILEGESNDPEACSQVGECKVIDLPADLPGGTPVEVRFRYEENGRLGVSVRIEGADTEIHHELHRQNMLSQEQLEQWRAYVCGAPRE